MYPHCVALIRARQEGKESAQLNHQKKTWKQILCPASVVKLNLIHAVMLWEYLGRVCVWGSNRISMHWFGMHACGGMLLKGESTASVNDTLTARFGAVYILCRRSEVSSSAGLLNNDRVIALVWSELETFALIRCSLEALTAKMAHSELWINVTRLFGWIGNKAND